MHSAQCTMFNDLWKWDAVKFPSAQDRNDFLLLARAYISIQPTETRNRMWTDDYVDEYAENQTSLWFVYTGPLHLNGRRRRVTRFAHIDKRRTPLEKFHWMNRIDKSRHEMFLFVWLSIHHKTINKFITNNLCKLIIHCILQSNVALLFRVNKTRWKKVF